MNRKVSKITLQQGHYVAHILKLAVSVFRVNTNEYICLLRVWPGWCAKKDTRFILVRAECLYVQFLAAARVITTEKFIVGVTNERERDRSQVSDENIEWMLRAWLLLSCV